MTYERFGVEFVRRAVTPERIEEAVARAAGDTFRVGPVGAGPAGIATAVATGRPGRPVVQVVPGDLLHFVATLPLDLDLEIRVGGVPTRYVADLGVPLHLTVRAMPPLELAIDVEPVQPDQVGIDLIADGIAAGVIQKVGNVELEVRRAVARAVNERLSSESARAGRRIDVAAFLDGASW